MHDDNVVCPKQTSLPASKILGAGGCQQARFATYTRVDMCINFQQETVGSDFGCRDFGKIVCKSVQLEEYSVENVNYMLYSYNLLYPELFHPNP